MVLIRLFLFCFWNMFISDVWQRHEEGHSITHLELQHSLDNFFRKIIYLLISRFALEFNLHIWATDIIFPELSLLKFVLLMEPSGMCSNWVCWRKERVLVKCMPQRMTNWTRIGWADHPVPSLKNEGNISKHTLRGAEDHEKNLL